ncbi:MAG: DUF692 domain-containing protein [Lysobacteraceae bacterium]|nr:MAG: DUF692 domain-containing protein [Xanthomonadaceae bacterium]
MTAPSPLPHEAVGLGLRRPLLPALREARSGDFDFLEAAPENWIGVGGSLGDAFAELATRYPIVFHGLSLSIGGPAPVDETFLFKVRKLMDTHRCPLYSEHLSACGDRRGQLYDLLPLPFSEEAVRHTAARIRRTQDILGQRIAIENISYYAAPFQRMTEIDFVNAVLAEADCLLLLDVNNIVVNATNHRYDASRFLAALPAERIAYLHVAGHYDEAEDLKIDTHGAAVCARVWDLLEETYRLFGPRPTLLERDFNLPPFEDLLDELGHVRRRIAPSARATSESRHAA